MQPILHSYAYSLDFIREQVADVPDELLTAQLDGIANHPEWTIGHLVFIAQAIGEVIGIEPWLSDEWASQFGPGSTPKLSSAVSRTALLSALEHAQTRLSDAVAALTDEQLDAAFPDPAYSDLFPTVRHALAQVLVGHTAFHVGQISIWRRALNLAPLNRSYE